jgi:hypothetical protein
MAFRLLITPAERPLNPQGKSSCEECKEMASASLSGSDKTVGSVGRATIRPGSNTNRISLSVPSSALTYLRSFTVWVPVAQEK